MTIPRNERGLQAEYAIALEDFDLPAHDRKMSAAEEIAMAGLGDLVFPEDEEPAACNVIPFPAKQAVVQEEQPAPAESTEDATVPTPEPAPLAVKRYDPKDMLATCKDWEEKHAAWREQEAAKRPKRTSHEPRTKATHTPEEWQEKLARDNARYHNEKGETRPYTKYGDDHKVRQAARREQKRLCEQKRRAAERAKLKGNTE